MSNLPIIPIPALRKATPFFGNQSCGSFAEQQPRRMLLADPIFAESSIFNLNEFKMFIRLDYCQC